MASITLDNKSPVHHDEDKASEHGEDQADARDHADEGEDASAQ